MFTRRSLSAVLTVGVALIALIGGLVLHARGVARRESRARELADRRKAATGEQSLFLGRVREASELRAKLEDQLEPVDSILEHMNADIAVAHVRREPIDLRFYELNQKQHELLASDLAVQRKRLADLDLAAANLDKEEQELSRDERILRESSWLQSAFW
jgi:hypothetical protein